MYSSLTDQVNGEGVAHMKGKTNREYVPFSKNTEDLYRVISVILLTDHILSRGEKTKEKKRKKEKRKKKKKNIMCRMKNLSFIIHYFSKGMGVPIYRPV